MDGEVFVDSVVDTLGRLEPSSGIVAGALDNSQSASPTIDQSRLGPVRDPLFYCPVSSCV